jgi:lipid II:glycine glycyltransferase (peptidoglycan interpeptide bridge formation enzyme)
MNKKQEEYRTFCQTTSLPVFFQPWWLDTVCGGEDWKVCLAKDKRGVIIGVLPYFITKKWGLSIIRQPSLTPHLGAWYDYPENIKKQQQRYGFEIKVLQELIEQLPNPWYLSLMILPNFSNWLPFFWQKFQATTFYTYQLKDLANKEQLFSNFKGNVRTEVRKAANFLTFHENETWQNFWQLNELTYKRQGMKMPYTKAFFKTLQEAIIKQESGQIVSVRNESNEPVAAAYLLFDKNKVYYLAGGHNRSLDKNCAISFLIWEILQSLSSEIEIFDFEGSMIKNIEFRFRSFGGEQIPYIHLFKAKNKMIDLLLHILK